MDRFLKRQKTNDGLARGTSLDQEQPKEPGRPPACIISWNCNSLKLRAERKELGPAIASFLAQGCEALLLQETRIKPEDKPSCESALRAAGLKEHLFYWGLHPGNKRYSGTLLAVHKACRPLSARYTLAPFTDPKLAYRQRGTPKWEDPEQEGRLVVLEYPQCWLVGVYTPNCSWFGPGRTRREDWDHRFASAVQTLQGGKPPAVNGQAAQQGGLLSAGSLAAGITGRPVLVVGDINVCHTPLDVSHPDFFANATKPNNVGVKDPGLPGQPGYTQEERDRFGQLLLDRCGLVDTYRQLQPEQKRLTWAFASSTQFGRYNGKYMGLDYALVSASLWDAGCVLTSTVMGQLGTHDSSNACCLGSDHVPIKLTLDWSKAPPVEATIAAGATLPQ